MIMKPMVRNNICINAHPVGCARETLRQIEYVAARKKLYEALPGPRAVLVIGASTGYGLASRIAAAFGFGAATVGVSYEKAPSETKVGTPGWYDNRAFEAAARAEGLVSHGVDGDAYSAEVKAEVIRAARELGLRFDLVVYSLASPVRLDPETGVLHKSAIKPLRAPYRGRSVDVFTGRISEAEVQPATEEEAAETVKVMGGEDWALWIEALAEAGVLAPSAVSVAYSYVGPELSWPIYRDGTIGRAKAHLEATAAALSARHADRGLRAYVSINKALVTRASAVIPVIPLYVSTLFKVMKERGSHEDCVAQIDRLYRDRLYAPGPGGSPAAPALDPEGRIRLDDLEMSPGVQAEVEARMAHIVPENLATLADVEGFRLDFLRIHGFEVPGVDYEADIAPDYDPLEPAVPPEEARAPGDRAR
ncbi:MAG: trans-2-enoyl-CoA reductase family protein [Spirochaetaceae bacterium]|nr:trans-2-enoyl-CoA reductase family protein [Spirochaetaceae bacterium]